MADMDGSNRHLFLSLPNGTWPNGLAIDTKVKTVYWADAKLHRIESISMDKSSRAVIYQSLTAHYFSIVLMGNHLYYNDWTEPYISRMTKAGSLLEQFGPSVLQRSYGMYAYNYTEITQGSSVCEISDCQQLCLPKQLGQHTCGCKNGYSLSSDKISCQIDNSKIIIKPLTVPHNVTEGRQLEIQCEFNTTSVIPSSGYSWRKNGIRIPGQSSSIYRLQRVQRSDDGNYTCAVDIDGSTITATIILNVLYPPNVTVPLEMKVIESTTLSITCTAVANPSIFSFKWTGPNGQDLTKYDFEATTHTTLTMPYIGRTKSGEYSCTASSTMIESPAPTRPITARSSKITIVHILYAPKDESSHEIVNVTVNSNVMLNCSVDSNPQPSSYKWYSPGGTVKLSTRDLLISNIQKTEGGDYRCEAVIVLVPTEGEPITKMYTHITTVNILCE
ncbi:sialoadhesin-like [Patella vulgata]|uniref:sialoadhesin-like n=1 Tax=Patella vulgata TaxID=6465 RepID=UPI0024A7DC83|nr:sialoadhesin-like [Patella vulgata]